MYSNDTRQDFITLLVRVVHVAYIFLNLPMHISFVSKLFTFLDLVIVLHTF
jgi:hypothetical protein